MNDAVKLSTSSFGRLAESFKYVYSRAEAACMREQEGNAGFAVQWLKLANAMVFPTIRRKMIGSNPEGPRLRVGAL